jgi:hypothetical protein
MTSKARIHTLNSPIPLPNLCGSQRHFSLYYSAIRNKACFTQGIAPKRKNNRPASPGLRHN